MRLPHSGSGVNSALSESEIEEKKREEKWRENPGKAGWDGIGTKCARVSFCGGGRFGVNDKRKEFRKVGFWHVKGGHSNADDPFRSSEVLSWNCDKNLFEPQKRRPMARLQAVLRS